MEKECDLEKVYILVLKCKLKGILRPKPLCSRVIMPKMFKNTNHHRYKYRNNLRVITDPMQQGLIFAR